MNRYSHIYKTFSLFLHLARKTYPKHSVPPVENNPVRCLSPACKRATRKNPRHKNASKCTLDSLAHIRDPSLISSLLDGHAISVHESFNVVIYSRRRRIRSQGRVFSSISGIETTNRPARS